MLFEVLLVAPDAKAKFVTDVDPAKGPISVSLEPANRADLAPKQVLRGQVVDPSGNPVVGVKVEPGGVRSGTGTRYGSLPGIDPVAITGEDGRFWITSEDPFEAMQVTLEARGFARRSLPNLASGQEHLLKLAEGASVTGRVLQNEKPVGGIAIGMAGVDRSAGEFVGSFEIGTDSEGRFLFLNLPPDTDYYLYGLMSSVKEFGAIPAQRVHTEGDGSVTDIGHLKVVPAVKLEGQVVLSDGAPIPSETRVTVGLDEAWDSQYVEVDEAGRFRVEGIPPDSPLSVGTRVKGYHFSGKNHSLDPWNPFSLAGRLTADKTDLQILLEPGRELQSSHVPPEAHPKNFPLRGAETPTDLSHWRIIRGRVVDAETGDAISQFEITPGTEGRFGRHANEWQTHRKSGFTDGKFEVVVPKESRPMKLMAEADGYLPAASEFLEPDQRVCDFRLDRGTGIEGTVLLPNGEPAAGVSVVLSEAGEQLALFPDGRLVSHRTNATKKRTDANGGFSFPPRLGDAVVYASGEAGYAEITTDKLASGAQLRLQAWGRIEGMLVKDGKPVADTALAARPHRQFDPTQAWINYQHRATTDALGRFTFEHLPPGELQIVTLVPVGDSPNRGWMHRMQKVVRLQPGESLKVEVEHRNGGSH